MSIEVEDMVFAPIPIPEAVPLTEWRALFHDSPLAIAYVSQDLRLLRVNGPFAVLCGPKAGYVLSTPRRRASRQQGAVTARGVAVARGRGPSWTLRFLLSPTLPGPSTRVVSGPARPG